jgi:hypothetical protein
METKIQSLRCSFRALWYSDTLLTTTNAQFYSLCIVSNTECPNRYRTRHFLNNSNTNEDIAKKFEEKYVRCVRNEEECVCSMCLYGCNIFIGLRIIKEMPGSVASGTPCII